MDDMKLQIVQIPKHKLKDLLWQFYCSGWEDGEIPASPNEDGPSEWFYESWKRVANSFNEITISPEETKNEQESKEK